MFLITGGGTGIGQALAVALANQGHEVLIAGRRIACLEETAAQSTQISWVAADISTEIGRSKIIEACHNKPQLSGLVHNAGTINPMTAINDITLEEWRHAFSTNVEPVLFLTQSLLPMLENGRVLNVSSGMAHFAAPSLAAYCTTKAAMSMLTKCWQVESSNVAFSSIMPGITDTQMQGMLRDDTVLEKDQAGFYQALHQENRLITCATVASFLSWLLLIVDKDTYVSQEWDIYDTTHHQFWLKEPHKVHPLD